MSSTELQLIPLDGPPQIVEEPSVAVDRDLVARIDAVWATAPVGSFDGAIFNVHELSPTRIVGGFTHYRYYFASRRDPAIAAELQLLPLGVSGIVRSSAGALFGRRARGVTDFEGSWELAPSGGVAPQCRRPDGELSLEAQLLAELAEETPFDHADVAKITPLLLAVDVDVIDVCFAIDLQTPGALEANEEYAELRWVTDVPRFLADRDVIELSRRLAEHPLADLGGGHVEG